MTSIDDDGMGSHYDSVASIAIHLEISEFDLVELSPPPIGVWIEMLIEHPGKGRLMEEVICKVYLIIAFIACVWVSCSWMYSPIGYRVNKHFVNFASIAIILKPTLRKTRPWMLQIFQRNTARIDLPNPVSPA